MPGVKEKINLEIKETLNKNSSTTQTIWDTFKAYIRGILIAIKSVKCRVRNLSRSVLLGKIADLEVLNQQNPAPELVEEISWLYHQVNIIDVLDIAQSLIYAKQSAFEYRDKAGKQVARLLSEHSVRKRDVPMKREQGGLISTLEEKLKIFVKYYERQIALFLMPLS